MMVMGPQWRVALATLVYWEAAFRFDLSEAADDWDEPHLHLCSPPAVLTLDTQTGKLDSVYPFAKPLVPTD